MSKPLLNDINKQLKLMGLNEQSLGGLSNLLNVLGVFGNKSEKTDDETSDEDLKSDEKEVSDDKITTKSKVKHSYSGEQGKNADIVIDEMNKMGITDPNTQIGILSVLAKESGFNMAPEWGYSKTSNDRIRSVFGKRASKLSDSELTNLKKSDEDFFEHMYGVNSGVRLGNTEKGDGYKYRGRGFNGLTGRGNYKKYGNLTGLNLENNPDLLKDPRAAAKVAIAFMLKGKTPESLPKFNDEKEASKYFADLNAGGSSSRARSSALNSLSKFEKIA